MNDRLRVALVTLLCGMFVVAPAHAEALTAAPLSSAESGNSVAEAEDPDVAPGRATRVSAPDRMRTLAEQHRVADPASRPAGWQTTGPVADHVPRHLVLCVWRE